jgi:hypothetical protein
VAAALPACVAKPRFPPAVVWSVPNTPAPLPPLLPAPQVCFREDGGDSYYNDYFTKAREAAQTITATEEDDCVRLACPGQQRAGKRWGWDPQAQKSTRGCIVADMACSFTGCTCAGVGRAARRHPRCAEQAQGAPGELQSAALFCILACIAGLQGCLGRIRQL